MATPTRIAMDLVASESEAKRAFGTPGAYEPGVLVAYNPLDRKITVSARTNEFEKEPTAQRVTRVWTALKRAVEKSNLTSARRTDRA